MLKWAYVYYAEDSHKCVCIQMKMRSFDCHGERNADIAYCPVPKIFQNGVSKTHGVSKILKLVFLPFLG